MKAIRVAKYGGPEELQLQELPPPKPGAGEVLVRVQAAGVNYADIYFRNGAVPRPTPFRSRWESREQEWSRRSARE